MGDKQFSDEEIIDALKAADGIQSDAADALGCSYETIRLRARDVPEVNQALVDGLERLRGKARRVLETGLTSADEKISVDTAKWILARLDKGTWSERQEVTGADGGDLKVSIEYVNRAIEE